VEPVLIPKLNVVKSLAADRPAGLILEIDIRELLAVAVPHDEASVVEFFSRPGRREAAGTHTRARARDYARVLLRGRPGRPEAAIGVARQCTKLLFADKGRFNTCWTN